jgi:transposase
MAEPYDIAFRERAVRAYNAGEGGYHELARVFGIAFRTLQRWVARYRVTGELAAQPKGGGWVSPIDDVLLRTVVREMPDGTVGELCWEYNRRVRAGDRTNETSFRRAMRRIGFVHKKNGPSRPKSIGRMSRPSVTRSGRR